MNFDLPHRRLNPLTGEWLLVSPHRAKRPWLGQVEKAEVESIPAYDPKCYLCPGNIRNTGKQNPEYRNVFVFDNDFAALLEPTTGDQNEATREALFQAQSENGICRVVCFSPRHDLSLPQLSQTEVEQVIQTWSDQTRDLGEKDFIQYVQVFENKGAIMGASNPHPHSQIWGTSHIPNEPYKELLQQEKYLKEHQSCLLCDYLAAEQEKKERLVIENDYFTALVPFWAIWPFETMVIAQPHLGSLLDLGQAEISGLADILRRLTALYDRLFGISFPYSMGFHQVPWDGKEHPGWHLHAHFYPPLLRSATVRKFMVGFELLSMPQRDLTPETAAQRLRELAE